MTPERPSVTAPAARVPTAEALSRALDQGAPWVVLDVTSADWADVGQVIRSRPTGATVLVACSRDAVPTNESAILRRFDCVLAPGGPVGLCANPDVHLDAVVESLSRRPAASHALASVLRAVPHLDVPTALGVESAAYSMLLASTEFRSWRLAHPARPHRGAPSTPVRVDRTGDTLHVRLDHPDRRNAVDAVMRDALVAALEVADADHDITAVEFTGEGPVFSAGGDLDEFGTAEDPGSAHQVRRAASPAELIDRLTTRLGRDMHATIHGAVYGAGIELPSFAGRLTAAPGTTMHLPEIAMGLIPGAGGTVGITRRVGRWRTAAWALSGQPLDVRTALEWGLVDDVS